MNFETVIGLEIHVEMKTKSKMFSNAPVTYGKLPNTNVSPVDMAFPGTMPTVNKQAVINAIRVSHALNMSIDHTLYFDRKNYFYSDLPKGYQITQNDRPIGSEGKLVLQTSLGEKVIGVERLHMEEDTCKQLHSWDCTLLDYNRAGVPLIEIVSKPDIRSAEEAMKYVEKIRSIVSFLDVSDGKMEEGSLRCDVNISLRPYGSEKFGNKVEIKNLNSIANVGKAIEFEAKRQAELLLSGKEIQQETRRFDDASKETILMRVKTDAVDYKYYREANIAPIKLSDKFIEDAIKTSPELPDKKLQRYLSLGLNDYDANLLLADKDNSVYFDNIIKDNVNPKLAANWVIGDIQSYLNKNNSSIKDFPISSKKMGELINTIEKGTISNKQGREVFQILLTQDKEISQIINDLGMAQVSDTSFILDLVNEVLNEFPQSIEDYKNGKDRAVGFLVGQIMKKSKGKANPQLTNKMVVEELKKR